MKRLIEQTACPHGRFNQERHRVCSNETHKFHNFKCLCPGGSSREVAVDYVEGARALLQADEYHLDPTRRNIQIVRAVVEAALGGGS